MLNNPSHDNIRHAVRYIIIPGSEHVIVYDASQVRAVLYANVCLSPFQNNWQCFRRWTTIILVAPVQPMQAWFATALKTLVTQPLLLHPNSWTLPQNPDLQHPLNKMRLAVILWFQHMGSLESMSDHVINNQAVSENTGECHIGFYCCAVLLARLLFTNMPKSCEAVGCTNHTQNMARCLSTPFARAPWSMAASYEKVGSRWFAMERTKTYCFVWKALHYK